MRLELETHTAVPLDGARDPMPYNFSIVGVQKSGTSTLAGTLREHPLVCRPPRKEAHFFNNEAYDWDHPDYESDYTAPRRASIHRLVGDSTPIYLFWPRALERMRDYRPDMALIAIFRDPVERLFSHWTMLRTRDEGAPDWPAFIRGFDSPVLPTALPEGIDRRRFKHQSGFPRGLYGQQLERGLALFAREQWLLLEFRSMLDDFDSAVRAATDHLGLPRFSATPPLRNRYAGADRVNGTAPSAGDVARLAARYAEDLALFERLSGIDTSTWPTRRVLDASLDPEELAVRLASRGRSPRSP